MISLKNLYWLAGLMEGEGHFGLARSVAKGRARSYVYHYPIIQLRMCDGDVVQRAASLFSCSCTKYKPKKKNHKPYWQMGFRNAHAAAWMMTLYTLLGSRRQEAIKTALAFWRKSANPRPPKDPLHLYQKRLHRAAVRRGPP